MNRNESLEEMRPNTIDDFVLSDKQFLRYGLWQPPHISGLGTVIILADYGMRIEDIADSAAPLLARGFCVAAFEWFSSPTRLPSSTLPVPLADFRLSIQHLREIFSQLFIVHLPAPFYGFGIGLGALFGLAAQPYLRSQMRRMVLISPLLAPHGHRAGGLFHRYSQWMCDLGLAGWRTNQPLTERPLSLAPCPTLGCYQGMLDAAQWLSSPSAHDQISIPFLCILTDKAPSSDPDEARQFCERVRGGASLTLRQASHFPFERGTAPDRQFWRAFDSFIPGTGAPTPDRSLEDGLVL